MLLNYLLVAFRHIQQNKIYNLINIGGLTIGMTTFFIISLFINHELSFDRFHTKAERIFRITQDLTYPGRSPQTASATSHPIAPFLKVNLKEIENYTRITPVAPPLSQPATIVYQERRIIPGNLVYADTSLLSIFDFTLLEGDKNTFLKDPDVVVLTQSTATKVFGKEPALHKVVQFDFGDSLYSVKVSGIISDFPQNSHLQADGLVPFPRKFKYGFSEQWPLLLGPTYVLLDKNADVKATEASINQTLRERKVLRFSTLKLQPLSQVHAGSMEMEYDYLNWRKVDRKNIHIFSIVAILVFITACINFVNLTTARSGLRGKEIGVKKTLGASRAQIILQFLTEAFVVSAIAAVFSLIIGYELLPYLNEVFEREISLLDSPQFILVLLAMLVIAALISGLYPALIMSAFNTVHALKGSIVFRFRKVSLLYVLVVSQFAIASVLTIVTIIVLQQLNYMQSTDLGLTYSQVINVPLSYQAKTNFDVLKTELGSISGVSSVTSSSFKVGNQFNQVGVHYLGPDGVRDTISINLNEVAPNYLSFYDIKLTKGRNFTPNKLSNENEYIINEALAKKIGWEDPIGKSIAPAWLPLGVVVGVTKDFHYNSLHQKIEPLLMHSSNYGWMHGYLSIKVSSANMGKTLTRLKDKWGTLVTDQPFEYEFLDDHFEAIYRSDKQASQVISVVGGLTILIACLGLFSLSTILIQKRLKEIGVRKVLGASTVGIAYMLSKQFVRLTVIAFIIAAPVAYYCMHLWLQNFAYRISIQPFAFLFAFTIALAVTLATIAYQSFKAAFINPVRFLKEE